MVWWGCLMDARPLAITTMMMLQEPHGITNFPEMTTQYMYCAVITVMQKWTRLGVCSQWAF